jgi:hypothetical protein
MRLRFVWPISSDYPSFGGASMSGDCFFAMLSAIDLTLFETIPAKDPSWPREIWLYGLARAVLQVWVGIYGNKITARHLLAHGWKFAKPEDEATRWAKTKWKIEIEGRT